MQKIATASYINSGLKNADNNDLESLNTYVSISIKAFICYPYCINCFSLNFRVKCLDNLTFFPSRKIIFSHNQGEDSGLLFEFSD